MDQESNYSEQWTHLTRTGRTERLQVKHVEKAAAMEFDAFGKPETDIFYGNTQFCSSFNECFSINVVDIDTQYCLMGMSITDSFFVSLMPPFTEAICFPSNYTFNDIISITNAINILLNDTHINLHIFVNEKLYDVVPFYYCTPEAKASYSTCVIVILTIISIFGAL